MYQDFYRLRELPFELTPNPKYLFLTQQHREALSTLQYGLFSAKPITVLIGEAGTGKTTLLHAALRSDRCKNVRCVYLSNPTITRPEFVELLSQRFGLSASAGESKTRLLFELDHVLRERRANGIITALVIDEAQALTAELLEEIRLLANVETATEKLLPLVLAGQPELKQRLNEPMLRQLKQRVTLRCQVAPFELSETASYIATRIRTAGGDAARMFTREAVMLIHERSNGIARIVSVICDNALVTGFALGQERINAEIILEVVRDFDLVSQGGLEGSPAPESRPEPSRSIHGPRDESGGAELDSVAVAAAGDPNDAEAAAEPRELFAGPGRNRRLSFLRRS